MGILWEHHIISQKFEDHSAFRGLNKQTLGVQAPQNLIYLPADYELARKMGVSPHPGGHDFRYYEAVDETLDLIATIEDPNLRAKEIRDLMDAMRVGLINGDLYTNVPIGGTGEEVARGVETVVKNYAGYRAKNRNQVRALAEFDRRSAGTGNDHLGKWSAILGHAAREKLLSKAIRENPRLNITSGNKDLAGTPWQQNFVATDDSFRVPGSEPVDPNHVPQLPGFIPSPLAEFAPEGFTRSDPSLTYGLSGFPAGGPDWQQFGQLPSSTAAPSMPQILQFNPESGDVMRFMSDGSPALGPNPYEMPRNPNDPSPLLGLGVFGAAMVAPELLATLPAWASALSALGITGAAASSSADAKPGNNSSGGVFATGAPPYNPFSTDAASNASRSGGLPLGAQSSAQPSMGNTLDQQPVHSDTFGDRFGNWPGTAPVATPSTPFGQFSAPAARTAGATAPDEVRRLARVNTSNAGSSVFESGSAPVPYLPSSEFDDRFGNWRVEGKWPQQASSPVGTFADEPSYAIPPPIWGLEAPTNPRHDSEEWFSRWIRPLLRQD
ncbi:AHH domain-containing protein [Bradyrhizobium sp. GCM10027634]|uniref:AHH domain-containing protein n=1 Tax=unclassified Bradyrhizobium TaxID=2631580 RepID=UPI00188A259D|nr:MULTISPECIES: AHH domain-containing protein [unclassified Bradyrhizobium]MDN5004625.1 AHH domain-containing protein [Bradyrhizobium sp. WYCCWR 12677]QOZ43935.1 hypothetical protein XH89_10880 [Bradyrhizobium sp. CCBAU 53340]